MEAVSNAGTVESDEDLALVREIAQEYLNTWDGMQTVEELSSSRRKAVTTSYRRLRSVMDSLVGVEETTLRKQRTSKPDSPPATAARLGGETARSVSLPDSKTEKRVGVTLDELAALMVLDGVRGFGPQKFKAMYDTGMGPHEALTNPETLPISGKTGDQLKRSLRAIRADEIDLAHLRASRQILAAAANDGSILTYRSPLYPRNVLDSNNPVPVLYATGDLSILTNRKAVACVGSRSMQPRYIEMQQAFARMLAYDNWVVVSGFALGADTAAHVAAVEAGGSTVCVMPCGLDRSFPPENKKLHDQWRRAAGVAFISEFPFGTGASSMTLRKRNKLIVAAALGVLVGQSSKTGGAMNAFRTAVEQRKPVATFASNGQSESDGNEYIAIAEHKVATTALPASNDTSAWASWVARLSS